LTPAAPLANIENVISSRPAASGRPRLLVVGAGPFQMELLRAARELAEVVAVDGSARAPGLALADIARVVDVRDTGAVVALARALGVRGVATAASDVAVPAVSAVVEALGLVGLRSEVSERCRDKLQAFEAVSAAGLAVPATLGVGDLGQAQAAIAELGGYPVVIKPRSGGGGRGVSVVQDVEQLSPALARARANYVGSGEGGVLVQQWVDGRSLGAEVFLVGGEPRALFVLDDQFEPGFVSPVGHSLPPQIDAATAAEVAGTVTAFGKALGLSDGGVNFDLRVANGRTVLIEVNPRLGGNSITDLIRSAYGADMARAAALCALGRDPTPALQRRSNQAVAARLILKPGSGIARYEQATDEIAAREGVIALDLTVRDGEPSALHVDDFCLLGRCLVKARSTSEAAALAERIAHEVAASIRLEPRSR
jgi:biotin carboxylase